MYADQIEIGVRQVDRWLIAAQQDKHPGIKMLHSNYAVGNIDMLRQQFSDGEIQRVTGQRILDLHKTATALQDEAFEEAIAECPRLRVQTAF